MIMAGISLSYSTYKHMFTCGKIVIDYNGLEEGCMLANVLVSFVYNVGKSYLNLNDRLNGHYREDIQTFVAILSSPLCVFVF